MNAEGNTVYTIHLNKMHATAIS